MRCALRKPERRANFSCSPQNKEPRRRNFFDFDEMSKSVLQWQLQNFSQYTASGEREAVRIQRKLAKKDKKSENQSVINRVETEKKKKETNYKQNVQSMTKKEAPEVLVQRVMKENSWLLDQMGKK